MSLIDVRTGSLRSRGISDFLEKSRNYSYHVYGQFFWIQRIILDAMFLCKFLVSWRWIVAPWLRFQTSRFKKVRKTKRGGNPKLASNCILCKGRVLVDGRKLFFFFPQSENKLSAWINIDENICVGCMHGRLPRLTSNYRKLSSRKYLSILYL